MTAFSIFGNLAALNRAAKKNSPINVSLDQVNDGISSFEESGLPESYKDVFNANPYNNYTYQPSLFDKIFSFLGLRTFGDQYREDMASRSREYISQLVNQFREEEYNDPSSQANRLRNAGINPNLSGDVSSNTASENVESSDSPLSPDNGFNQYQDFVTGLFTIFGSLIGYSKDFNEIKAGKIAVQNADVDYAYNVLSNSLNSLLMLASPDEFKDRNSNILNLYRLDDSFFHSKKASKDFNHALNFGLNSIKGINETWKSLTENERNKYEFSRYYGFNNQFDSINNLSDVLKDLMNATLDAEYSYQLYRNKKYHYDEKVVDSNYSNDIPELAARSSAAEYKSSTARSIQDIDLQSVKRKLIKKLSVKADQGNDLASIAILLLSLLPTNFNISK